MKSIDLAAIDLNLLVAFAALYEERSVSGAAQRLYLGQPAMSAALSRLRILFADELFIRIGREMQPTRRAIDLAPGILAALQQIQQTLAANQRFDPASTVASFAIGSSDYTSCTVMPKLLEYCRQIAPQIDLRLIEFNKDEVGDLLEQGQIDVALGVFQSPPRQTMHQPLFQEIFVGMIRQGHPALVNGELSIESFANLPHALFTIRRDTSGEIDKILASHQLKRRIVLTTPHLLVLPSIIAASDLVATVPSRLAQQFICLGSLALFELPIQTQPWSVSMLWSKLTDRDPANGWLRQLITTACATI
jgi:DNA-binding transcriptional LysR family regulator